ncbi:sentrin-specific protease 1 [Colossoma macropomum]|uniref:sentrin-specific protease 1 n=1 Tax=Colossoma macropomum TaxID=42526 RepID=UPI001864F361|nr:sentrin-specific protease 1 [Colossoma macropomum]
MFNKLYQWLGTGIANLRNGVPADGDHLGTNRAQQDGSPQRKRPIDCLEDVDGIEEDRAVKRYRMGDFMDSMKTAAEGMKTHGSSVASWVCNSVSPTLRNMLPASPGSPQTKRTSLPAVNASGSAWTENKFTEKTTETLEDTFVAPSTAVEWKTILKSDSLRTEQSVTISKVGRRQVYTGLSHHDTHKTNGHSVNISPICTSKPCPSPRLGRPLYLRPHKSPSRFSTPGSNTGNASYTSMYEKTFPIRVVQSPSHGTSSRHWRGRPCCTAQESVREEEKEVYRQLLSMVSGGQSSFFHDSSHPGIRSHRDFSSFLTSSRRLLRCASPAGSGAGESSLDLSSLPPSPQNSSALPSPGAVSNGPESQTWTSDADSESGSRRPLAIRSTLSPANFQDASSQDTQSSAHDGDSVIFVKEQQGKRPESSSVPCFQAELWIKELTSLYDSRARERRRLIEEQEALASQLLRQRLSGEGQAGLTSVELQVRVPLEKEVPVASIIEEPVPVVEEQEFPELTEVMENEVNRALRGGSQEEVLSEGFRLTITRKDLQTLSHLNWLNDEVINFYMNMLVERSKAPHLPSVYTFNTFFYSKLRSSGYLAVRRWTKKVDIFSVDIILVPVHLDVHWCLCVVDFRKKSITYFDSMGGNNDEACRILLKYLKQENEDKRGQDLDTSDWTLQSKKRNEIPQQMNGSDCGMFTCKYAEYITKDKPITFTQKHMPYFRRRMVWEILNQRLL